jgi:AcrR family transcriptional regulator
MKAPYHHGHLASELVRVAIAQLNENGVDSITLRGVCGELGVSQSAAYHHFENKEALLQAMSSQGEAELTRRFKAAIEGIGKNTDKAAISRFDALGRAYINFAIEEPHLFTLTFGPMCNFNSEEIDAESMEMLRHSLTELAERGLISPKNIEPLALLAWTSVHGFSQLVISGLMSKELVEPLLASIRHLVLKQEI